MQPERSFFGNYYDTNALPFTGPKMFCAGPNFLSQPQNLTAFSASFSHQTFIGENFKDSDFLQISEEDSNTAND